MKKLCIKTIIFILLPITSPILAVIIPPDHHEDWYLRPGDWDDCYERQKYWKKHREKLPRKYQKSKRSDFPRVEKNEIPLKLPKKIKNTQPQQLSKDNTLKTICLAIYKFTEMFLDLDAYEE